MLQTDRSFSGRAGGVVEVGGAANNRVSAAAAAEGGPVRSTRRAPSSYGEGGNTTIDAGAIAMADASEPPPSAANLYHINNLIDYTVETLCFSTDASCVFDVNYKAHTRTQLAAHAAREREQTARIESFFGAKWHPGSGDAAAALDTGGGAAPSTATPAAAATTTATTTAAAQQHQQQPPPPPHTFAGMGLPLDSVATLQQAVHKLNGRKAAHERTPEAIHALPDSGLLEEKRALKQGLRSFDSLFERVANRAPEKADKEPLRTVYAYYKELKKEIGLRGATQPGMLAEMDDDMPAGGGSGAGAVGGGGGGGSGGAMQGSWAAGQRSGGAGGQSAHGAHGYESHGRAAAAAQQQQQQQQQQQHPSTGGSSLPNGGEGGGGGYAARGGGSGGLPHMQPPHTTAHASAGGGGGGGGGSASGSSSAPQAPTAAAAAAAAAQNLSPSEIERLRAEKKTIKRKLFDFMNKFKEAHGREVKTKEDRAPFASEYERYRHLKNLLQAVDGGGNSGSAAAPSGNMGF